MFQLELKNHPVWRDLTEILDNLDGDRLVREHLDECDYKICGYWDEQDKFYEEVILPRILESELVSSAIGLAGGKRTLQLRFALKVLGDVTGKDQRSHSSQKIGELLLIYNENFEFMDENWVLDIEALSRLGLCR
jgi:hypothetical protein